MTTFTTILVIVLLLLSTGADVKTQRPLASVVIGGLFSSTFLTLVLLPVIYEWVEARDPIAQAPTPESTKSSVQ